MFKRIMNIFRGFIGLFVSGIERANPKALIEVEMENLRKQIARFNDNLATHAGFIERLMRQIKTLEAKEKELTARTAANLKVGNRAVAGQMAMELQTVKSQLEENRQQLEVAEDTYKKMVKSRDVAVTEAKAKIEKLKRLMSETEMAEAQAELQEMAAGMITEIGGSGDTLDRVEGYLQERRDKAMGRARVASSEVKIDNFELKEAEQQALAEMALSEFEVAYGLKSPSLNEAAPANPQVIPESPKKELGPQEN